MSTLKRHATEHAKNTEHRDDCTWLSYLLSRDVISSFIIHTISGAGAVLILVHVFLLFDVWFSSRLQGRSLAAGSNG